MTIDVNCKDLRVFGKSDLPLLEYIGKSDIPFTPSLVGWAILNQFYSPKGKESLRENRGSGKVFSHLKKSDNEGVSFPSHYLEQGSLKVRDVWNKALEFVKFDGVRLEKIKDCNKEGIFLTYACPSKEHHYVSTRPYNPCNDSFCLYDSGRYGKKKGIEVYNKLASLPARYYGHYVFTTPSQFWDMLFDRKKTNRLKKVVRKSLSEFYNYKVGGIHRPHVWGDKKPENIGRREVHIHSIIPLLGFDKNKNIIHFSQYRRDLDKLRGIYKKNFCREFKVSFDGNIVVNYSFKDKMKNPEKLMNCCQYICRSPLELPLRDNMSSVVHFGIKRMMSIVEKFKFYDGYRSLTWFGFLASHVVRKYLPLLKMGDKEASMFFDKYEKGTCPICGLKMELVAVYYNNKLVLWKGKKSPHDEKEFLDILRVLKNSGGDLGWLFKSLVVG